MYARATSDRNFKGDGRLRWTERIKQIFGLHAVEHQSSPEEESGNEPLPKTQMLSCWDLRRIAEKGSQEWNRFRAAFAAEPDSYELKLRASRETGPMVSYYQ